MVMTKSERARKADELRERIQALRKFVAANCSHTIITVASGKGGVGKSTLAKELAYVWGAIEVDFDWDGGMVTRLFGFEPDVNDRAPVLDALETGTVPRLVKMVRRPDLVPGHPDLGMNQPSADVTQKALIAWNADYGRALCCDTHPGGGDPVTRGAIAAADRVLMPVILGTGELDALEEDLKNYDGYPLLLVLNKVGRAVSSPHLARLELLAGAVGVPIASAAIGLHPWLTTRLIRTVVTSMPGATSERTIEFVENIVDLAEEVAKNVAAR